MEEINKNKELKNEIKKINIEMRLIGWVGSFLLITAYALNSLDYLDSQNIIYPLMNLIAAFLLAIRVYFDKNWSNLFLEAFWAAIAITSLLNIIF